MAFTGTAFTSAVGGWSSLLVTRIGMTVCALPAAVIVALLATVWEACVSLNSVNSCMSGLPISGGMGLTGTMTGWVPILDAIFPSLSGPVV